jgi:20S proteasome subunit alpha 4
MICLDFVREPTHLFDCVIVRSVVVALFLFLSFRLQDARTIRKIVSIDDRTVLAFAGLTADARVLINKVRVEAQSYRLTMEDAPSVDYLARFLAKIQQKYTQQGGVRPFGIATLLAGVNDDDKGLRPYLYQTDPAGTHSRWKAQVIGGRNAKSLREFLEKQYQDLKLEDMTEQKCVRLAVQALLEVVDSGAKTMEICVVRTGGVKVLMSEGDLDVVVAEIEAEQQAEKGGTSASAPAAVAAATSGDD